MRKLIAAMLVLAACVPAAAQSPAPDAAKDYPNRAIHIVVPFPAGGPADVAARLLAQRMNEDWGQPVIVDNRPGGNTVIGAQPVAKAAPDGYTLLMAIDSTLVMNQFLYKSLPYDPINDFAPITTDDQDRLGAGGLGAERTNVGAGPDRQGEGRAGQAQLRRRHHHGAAHGLPLPQGRGPRHRLCAVQGHAGDRQRPAHRQRPDDLCRERHREPAGRGRQGARARQARPRRRPPRWPDIPTLAEAAGLPNLEDMSVWLGLVAPKGTPAPIIGKIQQKVAQILSDPAMREKSERTGAFPITSTPEQFGRFIRDEADRWSRVLKETNIKYD